MAEMMKIAQRTKYATRHDRLAFETQACSGFIEEVAVSILGALCEYSLKV